MLKSIPTDEEMIALIGKFLYDIWKELCETIDKRYDMERIWSGAGKEWKYEYKYRRGGKTLCSLYAKNNCIGFMIIFGKNEREKFENDRGNYSEEVQTIYDEAKTYRDGKWIMFIVNNTSMFEDFIKLLAIKRKPNIKY